MRAYTFFINNDVYPYRNFYQDQSFAAPNDAPYRKLPHAADICLATREDVRYLLIRGEGSKGLLLHIELCKSDKLQINVT